MYFKILKTAETEYKKYAMIGMVPVFAIFFLEENDEGYEKYFSEFYREVIDYSESDYPGEVTAIGSPVDIEDYNSWKSNLPTKWILSPFCMQELQFEPSVTEEEILWCFEWAMALNHINWLADDIRCEKIDLSGNPIGKRVKQDIKYKERILFYTNNLSEMSSKIAAAEAKSVELQNVDFATVETSTKYRVK